ncbi:MAG: hypothetical protein MJ082_04805 [Clostridia bacterium]|nr:hypothetical protein [Clostridia bacterium]
MVLVNESIAEGLPPRLYRTTGQIRADMEEIAERIREAKEKLSVRDCIVSAIAEHGDAEKLIPVLSAIVGEAEDTLAELTSLRDKLALLAEELTEVKSLVCR